MDGIATHSQAPCLPPDPVLAFGRERRMHARVYGLWVSLLRGRAMPAVRDFDAERLGAFADHAIMIELADGGERPVVTRLGRVLREEAGLDDGAFRLDQMPEKSVLHAMLHHLPGLVLRGAPLGFRAEHPLADGARALHRGILLPLADDDGRLAAIYGVIGWRRLAAVSAMPDVAAAIESALAMPLAAREISPWGDGPDTTAERLAPVPLAQQLAAARTWAALAATDKVRAGTLHAALGAAYDVLLAAQADRGVVDAPSTPRDAILRTFEPGRSQRERAAFVAVLHHGLRLGIGRGGLGALLDRYAGGVAAVAEAERRARRRARRMTHASDGDLPPPAEPIALTPLDAGFTTLIGALTGPARGNGMPAARVRAA